jgi:hypothetical protein
MLMTREIITRRNEEHGVCLQAGCYGTRDKPAMSFSDDGVND